MSNYNITQITNYDVSTIASAPEEIIKGGVSLYHNYKELTLENGALKSDDIFKFGYCANNNEGKNYPIFILLNEEDSYRPIYLGKTGMYEFQTEDWEDVNAEEEGTAILSLKSVKVPEDVYFCLDYCYSI